MGRSRKHRRHRKKREKKPAERMLRVTWPSGRVERIPDDGRSFPPGTMISWDAPGPSGSPEMRWSVVGGGWPFDD
ncbi:MAG: hypothetical protein KC912_10555 [Proteobacteria bacterium]|nr:hypothetical protein [Pseudomonadota bacterium]